MWEWNGVVGTGQSLSVGTEGRGGALTRQPFGNLKLSLGGVRLGAPPYDPDHPALSMVPLVEPIRAEVVDYPNAYPFNIYGETPHTAMANQISSLYEAERGGRYVTVHSVVGESGQGIGVIGKGAVPGERQGHAYAASLFEIAAIRRLAAAAGKTFGVRAIVLTHGETDACSATYEDEVLRLLADYEADIRAITGQNAGPELLLSQQQTCPAGAPTPASTLTQWKLGVDHRDRIVCVGPKYQYPYADDGLHLIASGYDRLGEKYGEIYYERAIRGRPWQPLQPAEVRRDGRTITVAFHVPVAPLAWDESLPAPHQVAHRAWAHGRGFEVESDAGELTIRSVAIRDRSVAIELASAPAAANLVVRYAVTQDARETAGGRSGGRIGQLRDSDPLVGHSTGKPQYNYALSFALPVD